MLVEKLMTLKLKTVRLGYRNYYSIVLHRSDWVFIFHT